MMVIEGLWWWKTLFHFCLNASVTNTAFLYQQRTEKTDLEFRMVLVQQLLAHRKPLTTLEQLKIMPAAHQQQKNNKRNLCRLCKTLTFYFTSCLIGKHRVNLHPLCHFEYHNGKVNEH